MTMASVYNIKYATLVVTFSFIIATSIAKQILNGRLHILNISFQSVSDIISFTWFIIRSNFQVPLQPNSLKCRLTKVIPSHVFVKAVAPFVMPAKSLMRTEVPVRRLQCSS